ncbi:MAG TPA: hypothetical protein VFI31_05185, partial [Pirellulales bacterium]|nr:hypothetical protein [Pirellulales bacterium]
AFRFPPRSGARNVAVGEARGTVWRALAKPRSGGGGTTVGTTSPLRGFIRFLPRFPRVCTRGYTPVPLRGSQKRNIKTCASG